MTPPSPEQDAVTEHCCANTDPPSVRCSWCGGRTWMSWNGYWTHCRADRAHPYQHDPRVSGLLWRLRTLVG